MLHMSMQAQITQRQSVVFTPQLQQAIKLLLLNNLELGKYADSAAEENPFLEVERPKALRGLPSMPSSSSATNDFDPVSLLEDTSGNSFRAHVFHQVEELIVDPKDRAIGYAIASHLEPTGWLPTPLSQIADNLKIEVEVVEGVLKQLQQAEPVGLFARNLAECLKLQVRCDDVEQVRLLVLIENLPLIQNGGFAELRRKLQCTKEELALALRQLRGLDPKPGLQLGDASADPIREPDIRAFQSEDGEWRVELNKATLPSIRVDEEMGREVRKVTMQEADKEFVRGSLQSARWLTRAIAQRNETNLKVAAEIVRFQKAFLEEGMHQMRPLKLKMIADNVGLHESTISRVTSAMMMETPQGAFPLKIFFSTAIESDDSEEGASAMVIREKIRKMIFEELPKRPLSDDTITGRLHNQGLRIARRTVAKYRKLDSIPSSSQRRRGYQLQAMM
jgi:RNA polymerase sigma-54 factor